MFFHSWSDIGRIIVVSTVLFLLIVVLLRLAGQQALAKMSGYDVVVTVTLGSIVASVILTRTMTVSDAAVALITLILLQESTRRLQSRWLPAHHAVREAPRVVLWDGRLLEDRLLATSVSADEVRAAVRRAGHAALEDIRLVVLENDGEWSVIARRNAEHGQSAFYGLDLPGEPSRRGNGAAEGKNSDRPAPSDRIP